MVDVQEISSQTPDDLNPHPNPLPSRERAHTLSPAGRGSRSFAPAGEGRWKRYPAYKDSGVEWLGEVPEHWEQSKVKYLANYLNGLAFKPSDWSEQGIKIIRIQNLTDPGSVYNYYEGYLDNKYLIRKGDILISWSASLGVYTWAEDEPAWLNQHIFKVTLNKRLILVT
jgi:restriction endonuclease S subunit